MDVFSIAQSGMQAAQSQFAIAAQNIANLDAPGYKASTAYRIDLSAGGVALAGASEDSTPGPIQPNGTEGSNVDLGKEMLNMTRSKLLYTANAALLKIGARQTGTLLDILDNRRNRG